MKQIYTFNCRGLRWGVAALLLLVTSVAANAYDFKVGSIYYNILSSSNKTCAVTYLYYNSSSNSEAYSGAVSIPETVTYNGTTYRVTEIGEYAFRSCKGLTSVTIPNSVTTIGGSAFSGCSGLTEVTIPEGVTSIKGWAFYYCTSLKTVYFNATACTSAGGYYYDGGYYYATVFSGSSVSKVIFGDNVTIIPGYLFYYHSSLTSVTFGNSVTTIGNSAFDYCTGLKSLTLPNSVTDIETSAFYCCKGLTGELVIPNSVTSIGQWAFYNCTGLTKVSIGEGLTSIVDRAFLGCSALTTFEVEEDNKCFCSKYGVLYSKDMTTLVLFPVASPLLPSFDIPDGVTTIGDYAFDSCTGLTELTIPESVASIGDYAFYYCSGLASVTIGNSVTEIGSGAFSGCTGLESVTSLNSEPPKCSLSGSGVFYKVDTSTCVLYVPIGSKKAYATADQWQDFLNIEETDATLMGGAVKNFEVDGIYYHVLSSSDQTCEVKYLYNHTQSNQDAYEGEVVIPKAVTYKGITYTVTAICDGAFYRCTRLTSVVIPESVTEMGEEAFSYCSNLESITCLNPEPPTCGSNVFSSVDKSACVLYVPGETEKTYSAASAWKDFKNIKKIKIMVDGVYYAYTTTGVKVTSKITDVSYPDYSEYVVIADNVTFYGQKYDVIAIEDEAFYGCTEVNSVTIGNGVTSIGDSAFYNCRAMRELTIGSRVETIGNSAFDSCRRLESLTSLNTTPPTCSASGNGVFYNVPVKTCTLYVTEGSLAAYASAYAWEDFLTIIDNQVDAIEDIMTNGSAEAVGYYTLDGKQVPTPQRGINVIRYSDGTTKKVLVK